MPQAVDVVVEDSVPLMEPLKGHGSPMQISVVAPTMAQTAAPSPQRLFEVLQPEVGPALRHGMGQSVAAALVAATELMGVADDVRLQLLGSSNPCNDWINGSNALDLAPNAVSPWETEMTRQNGLRNSALATAPNQN